MRIVMGLLGFFATSYLSLLPGEEKEEIAMTVRGPLSVNRMGRTLVHEHILCDFIGADKTGKHRYDPQEVINVVKPFLLDLKEAGFSTFIDCTPAFIGRDVEILRKLSEETGLYILTNTGYYGSAEDRYVPSHAWEETAEQLAERWIKEWEAGIEGTGIKPGFVKIGVDGGPLSEIDRKLVRAGIITHRRTGLPLACHTGEKQCALEVVEEVLKSGMDPSAFILVHADALDEEDLDKLSQTGIWLEYDGVSPSNIDKYLKLLNRAEERGYLGRVLLSQDAGWYWVGEEKGGVEKFRPYTTIAQQLVPALRKSGFSQALIDKLLIESPAKAFRIRKVK